MSSPRPTFAKPTAIPIAEATRYRWGDEGSRHVDDVIYVSSGGIHQIVFSLPAGGEWRHSPDNRTVFGADEVYIVLEGTLWLSNPQTGEVREVRAGETAFFRKDTWHHGFAGNGEPVRVLEYMSPPPSRGTSQAYARTKPYLEPSDWKYGEDRWLGRWPAARAEAAAAATMHLVTERDALLRLEGPAECVLVGLLCATEHLSSGYLRLPRGATTGPRMHSTDASYYVRRGHARVMCEGWPEPRRLGPEDGLFIPAGSTYEVHADVTEGLADLYFGIGGAYL